MVFLSTRSKNISTYLFSSNTFIKLASREFVPLPKVIGAISAPMDFSILEHYSFSPLKKNPDFFYPCTYALTTGRLAAFLGMSLQIIFPRPMN